MVKHARPLSPHLTIYKPQLTSVLSILHRISGFVLFLGGIALGLWLLALASGPEVYGRLQLHMQSWYGENLLILLLFALLYHLCNGIRHLCWDAGLGFSLPAVYRSGAAVLAATLVLGVLYLLLFYSGAARA